MSVITEAWRSLSGGETRAQRRLRREKERQQAAMLALGPAPTGEDLELQTGAPGETAAERRRRLKKLALAMQNGTDIYGNLTLGKTGLLSR